MSIQSLLAFAGPYLVWLYTAIIVGLGLAIYAIVRGLIRRIKEPKTRITLSRVSGTIVVFFVLVAILAVWVQSPTVFLLVAGLVSAGVAFSLQGPLTSLVAWLVLLTLKPFAIGDRVQSGDIAGDVVGFNPFFFLLLEIGEWSDGDVYTGRLVEVPNNQIMTRAVVNYSRNFGFLWDTVTVGIYYEADWAKARAIALAIAGRVSEPALAGARQDLERFRREHFMPRGRLEPQVFVALASTTINLSIRYVTDVWQRAWTRTQVVESILKEFAGAGIDIAYPSVVVRPTAPMGGPAGSRRTGVPGARRAGTRGPTTPEAAVADGPTENEDGGAG